VDAIALVVRCFEDSDVAHVHGQISPVDDCDVLDLELALADLEVVERRQEKVQTMAKAEPKSFAAELDILTRMKDHLAAGHLASQMTVSQKEEDLLGPLNLLTAKPRLYVANVLEGSLPEGGSLAREVLARAGREGAPALMLSAQLEAELAQWPPQEAAEYRDELGLAASSLDLLIQAGYELLDLLTFFTATGTKVVRAWTLRRGQTVYEAAGKIHTDMQEGFIRAEVIAYPDLMAAGGMAKAREQGLIRLEGRDYTVQDGDVIHIRFSPAR
jgi:GTP-binding protein YchF